MPEIPFPREEAMPMAQSIDNTIRQMFSHRGAVTEWVLGVNVVDLETGATTCFRLDSPNALLTHSMGIMIMNLLRGAMVHEHGSPEQ